MSALLMSGIILPVAFTASSAAVGYPATNVGVPGVSRGWQSAGTTGEWLQLDLGASKAIAGVALQAVVSGLSTLLVRADNSNPPTTGGGVPVIGIDENGRGKCSLAVSTTARYVRFNFGVSSGIVSVGSAFVFATATPTPTDPLYGDSTITSLDAQVRNDLPNGISDVYVAGNPAAELNLDFRGIASADFESIKRAARAAPCWFDFGLTDRGRQWPVRHIEAQTVRTMAGYNRESVGIKLREII